MTAADPLGFLARLDQARAAATPGEWTERQDFIDDGVPDNSKTINGGTGDYIGTIVLGYRGEDNAAAIVAEHNAVPKLTAALRAVLAVADEELEFGRDFNRHRTEVVDAIRRAITAALDGTP